MPDRQPLPPETVFIGIDWADREHVVCVVSELGAHQDTVPHTPEDLAEWVADLQRRFRGRPLAVAVELKRGGLINALMRFEQLILFPINPKQLARYRQALTPSGAKSDPQDAWLLASFLRQHHPQLRPWRPDDAQTRQLAELCELRRKMVDARKGVIQQLTATLKQYFPLLREIAGELSGQRALAVLKRWTSLQELRRAHPETLKRFFREHGVRNAQRRDELVQRIRTAVPLTTDPALIQPLSLYAQMLAQQIAVLNASIRQFEERIEALFKTHQDAELFRTLPGAGAALAPRLAVAFGTDRERFTSAADVAAYSGIAPVTQQSGRSRHVTRRRACSTFLRQTFHEFADHARKWSRWSGAYYQLLVSRGKKHQAAVRALAFKWTRILYRVWITRTRYDENRYLQHLKTHNSPILQFLEKVSPNPCKNT